MFDQALFANTNALFKECRLIDTYNTTIRVDCMVNLDKLWSYFGLKRLKTDQVLPVSIFCGPIVIVVKAGYRYARSKIIVNKANTSTQLIQQYALCPWVIYCSLYGSYLVFKWLKRCHTVPLSSSLFN